MGSKKENIFFILYLVAVFILSYHYKKHVILFISFVFVAISYPLFNFLYHKILLRFVNYYVKDYIKSLLNEIEHIVDPNIRNQLITEVILPLNIYHFNDLDKFIDDLLNFLNNAKIDEEKRTQVIDFINSKSFYNYIKETTKKRKMEKINNKNRLNIETPLNTLFTNYVEINADLYHSSILKNIHSNITVVSSYIFLFFYLFIIFTKINLLLLFIDVMLSTTYIFVYISFKNKKEINNFCFVIIWISNLFSNLLFVFQNMQLFTTQSAIILLGIKFAILTFSGNIVLNIMFKKFSVNKSAEYIENIIFYKIIEKCRIPIVWCMFLLIILVNIISFAFITYSNINIVFFSKFHFNEQFLIKSIKNSLLNYFNGTPFIDYTYRNDFFINITQSILAFLTNTVLLGNIIKYMIPKGDK